MDHKDSIIEAQDRLIKHLEKMVVSRDEIIQEMRKILADTLKKSQETKSYGVKKVGYI